VVFKNMIFTYSLPTLMLEQPGSTLPGILELISLWATLMPLLLSSRAY
jgi:hypothetical protein